MLSISLRREMLLLLPLKSLYLSRSHFNCQSPKEIVLQPFGKHDCCVNFCVSVFSRWFYICRKLYLWQWDAKKHFKLYIIFENESIITMTLNAMCCALRCFRSHLQYLLCHIQMVMALNWWCGISSMAVYAHHQPTHTHRKQFMTKWKIVFKPLKMVNYSKHQVRK